MNYKTWRATAINSLEIRSMRTTRCSLLFIAIGIVFVGVGIGLFVEPTVLVLPHDSEVVEINVGERVVSDNCDLIVPIHSASGRHRVLGISMC